MSTPSYKKGSSKSPSSSKPPADEERMDEEPSKVDNVDLDGILDRICDDRQAIVTLKGSSQYGDKLGNRISASTCGLAALNFARVAFKLEVDEGMQGMDLLAELLSHRTTQEITSICDYWKSDYHLEIEELLKVPVFKHSLSLQSYTYSDASEQHFYDLLGDMEDVSNERSVAVIITRPPEIVACLKIRIADKDVYVVFDSHPRPSHPDGLGFIINPNIEIAASYLSQLLSFDRNLLHDSSLQWQAQLLGHSSGHILLPLEEESSMTEMLLESSLALLSAYADVAKEKDHVLELRRKVDELERQKGLMEDKLRKLEQGRRDSERTKESPRSRGRNNDQSSWYSVFVSTPSSSQSIRRPPSRGEGKTDDWQTVKRKDKGKRPSDWVSHAGSAFWTQASGSKDKSPPPAQDRDRPTLESSVPGGFPNDEMTSTFDSDLAMAIECQRAFEAEDRQLEKQREMLSKMAPNSFQCAICLEDHAEDSIARVHGCNHPFCRECLRDYAKSKVGERRFPIICPVCLTDKDKRDPGVVNDEIIQHIGVSNEDYEIFEELQITSFSIPLHCRRCQQTMFVDRQEVQEAKIISCPWPRCGFIWCKACQQEVEAGGPQHSCDGSSELRHLMQQHGWKICPGCQTPVQKSEGCNHMTCITPSCNTHFCYIDGGLIIKGGTRTEIGDAIKSHYSGCTLFDYK